jgi:hypothetical protein
MSKIQNFNSKPRSILAGERAIHFFDLAKSTVRSKRGSAMQVDAIAEDKSPTDGL